MKDGMVAKVSGVREGSRRSKNYPERVEIYL